MNETEILAFLIKYSKGALSAADQDKLDAWYLHKAARSSLSFKSLARISNADCR